MWYVIVAIVSFALGVIFADVTRAEVKTYEDKFEDLLNDEIKKL